MDIGVVNGGTSVKCQPCGGADIWGAPSYTGEAAGDIGGGKGMQCYSCGGYGHMAKDCATKVLEKGSPKGLGKGQAKFGGGKGYEGKGGNSRTICYSCGKPGHLFRNCWSPKVKGGGKGVNEVSEGAKEE